MSATDFGDPDQVIHIPARELTGTREAKLAELDMFVTQLQVVRLALSGQPVRLQGFVGAPRAPRTEHRSVAWSWPVRRLRAVLNDWRANAERARRGRS
jgi:hypothetical protein